jgi:hypothetical protein
MNGDDRPGSNRGTPAETPVSAAETLSTSDRGRERSLVRDLGLLSLVAAPQAFTLVVTGDVDWVAFAAGAAVGGSLVALALRWPALSQPVDARGQMTLLIITAVGVALLAYYVLVVEPPEGRVASLLLGWAVGAAGARVDDAVRGTPGPAVS